MQVTDSIPWVHCATGNVLLTFIDILNANLSEIETLKPHLPSDSLVTRPLATAQVTNKATTRWRYLQSSKLDHQKEPLALVTILTLLQFLHLIQIWSPGGATCISKSV